jgi:D-proline reductase (dithiol) PrdB
VGLIQRAIEEAGIPTLSISLNRTITEKVKPPRAVLVGYPLGHPMGRPFDKKTQKSLLQESLTLLRDIRVPGTLVDASARYRFNGTLIPPA